MPRALVVSDSHVAKDTRILYQIAWLTSAGWTVDTLGRGGAAKEANGTHHAMPIRPFWLRLLANILFPRSARYRTLVASTIPTALTDGDERYDLVVLNEIELLPWFVRARDSLLAPGGRTHLDLHEFAFSQRRGVVHTLFFRRYRRWLADHIQLDVYSTRSVVSEGIADLYVETIGIQRPAIVRSCPEFVDQDPSPVLPGRIRLVHHGAAQAIRSPHLMVEALAELDDRFELHLMLIGAPALISDLTRRAEPFRDRVHFHPPVGVRDVAAAINAFDLEVVFYPPLTQNLKYALPNKVFEAVQGRVGLVVGESPDMAGMVREHGNGIVVEGWTARDLAVALNKLTTADIERMKQAADTAARVLNVDAEAARFFAAIGEPRG